LLPPPVIVATSPFPAKATTTRVDVVGCHPTTGQGRKSSTNASLGVSLGGAPTTCSFGSPINFEVRIESKFVSIPLQRRGHRHWTDVFSFYCADE
jgi:hypothetical protein